MSDITWKGKRKRRRTRVVGVTVFYRDTVFSTTGTYTQKDALLVKHVQEEARKHRAAGCPQSGGRAR